MTSALDSPLAPATTSERTLLREMLADLPSHTLLVGDAGFIGYALGGPSSTAAASPSCRGSGPTTTLPACSDPAV